MTRPQHARVFFAYISRLKRCDVKDIMIALDNNNNACYNLGLSSQLETLETLFNAILTGIGAISDQDLNTLERIIDTREDNILF